MQNLYVIYIQCKILLFYSENEHKDRFCKYDLCKHLKNADHIMLKCAICFLEKNMYTFLDLIA